jgi:hypothetical protein
MLGRSKPFTFDNMQTLRRLLCEPFGRLTDKLCSLVSAMLHSNLNQEKDLKALCGWMVPQHSIHVRIGCYHRLKGYTG